MRVTRVIDQLFFKKLTEGNNVRRSIIKIIMLILTLVVISTGILYVLEKPKINDEIEQDEKKQADENNEEVCSSCKHEKVTIHSMAYFIVVTLSTVGFGDITPHSLEGQTYVTILLLIVIVLIPSFLNELIAYMGIQSKYERINYTSKPDIQSIVLCGIVKIENLEYFLTELLHPDHGSSIKNVVILQNTSPSNEMELFLNNPKYELYLTYVKGNPMNEKDLARSDIQNAHQCIIITDQQAFDPYTIDYRNILIGLAIKKYVREMSKDKKEIKISIQLIKPESRNHYNTAGLQNKTGDQLILIEEFKMSLLAKSCFCPGIIALVSNLVFSAGDNSDQQMKQEWIKEYLNGTEHEIYREVLSPKFQGKYFTEVASVVYNEFEGIIFALELNVGGQTIIRLNPGKYVIPNTMENNIYIYIICSDLTVAQQVATYELSQEEIVEQNQKIQSKGDQQYENFEEELELDQALEFEPQNILSTVENNNNYQLNENDYCLTEPISLMEAHKLTIQDSNEINNHIVFCGIHPSIYYFLLPLRAKYLNELKYVIILHPEKPVEIWEYINRFPKIIYIKGDPLNENDLKRANINFADKAVIIAKEVKEQTEDTTRDQFNELKDAQSIFIYQTIKKVNPQIQIMIELVQNKNINYLKPILSNNDYMLNENPLLAAGEVYQSSIIDTLTSQSYYNPHILTILQQLLTGGTSQNQVLNALCEQAQLNSSNLWQIPVPTQFINQTFGELFNYLCLEKYVIPLGLYRYPGIKGNDHCYCFTNPPAHIKLNYKDKIFVLAYELEQQLITGIDIEESSQSSGQNEDNEKYSMSSFQTKLNEKKVKESKTMSFDKIKQINHEFEPVKLESISKNTMCYQTLKKINGYLQDTFKQMKVLEEKLTIQNSQLVDQANFAFKQQLSDLKKI